MRKPEHHYASRNNQLVEEVLLEKSKRKNAERELTELRVKMVEENSWVIRELEQAKLFVPQPSIPKMSMPAAHSTATAGTTEESQVSPIVKPTVRDEMKEGIKESEARHEAAASQERKKGERAKNEIERLEKELKLARLHGDFDPKLDELTAICCELRNDNREKANLLNKAGHDMSLKQMEVEALCAVQVKLCAALEKAHEEACSAQAYAYGRGMPGSLAQVPSADFVTACQVEFPSSNVGEEDTGQGEEVPIQAQVTESDRVPLANSKMNSAKSRLLASLNRKYLGKVTVVPSKSRNPGNTLTSGSSNAAPTHLMHEALPEPQAKCHPRTDQVPPPAMPSVPQTLTDLDLDVNAWKLDYCNTFYRALLVKASNRLGFEILIQFLRRRRAIMLANALRCIADAWRVDTYHAFMMSDMNHAAGLFRKSSVVRVMRAIMNCWKPRAQYLWRWRERQLSDTKASSAPGTESERLQLRAHIWRLEQILRQQGFDTHMHLQWADKQLADYTDKVQQLSNAMRVVDGTKPIALKMLMRAANSTRHIRLGTAMRGWKARYVAHRLERMRDTDDELE